MGMPQKSKAQKILKGILNNENNQKNMKEFHKFLSSVPAFNPIKPQDAGKGNSEENKVDGDKEEEEEYDFQDADDEDQEGHI